MNVCMSFVIALNYSVFTGGACFFFLLYTGIVSLDKRDLNMTVSNAKYWKDYGPRVLSILSNES